MASTYSALKIELIGTGEQSGTWGTTTNNNLGDAALGEAITGSADVAFSSADVTVTLTDTNATQTARNLRLNLTGTTGGARSLILGSGCQIEKLYLVNNTCADAITVKNTTGTGIAVPAGKTMFVYNNGTNVVDATSYLSSLTLGTALVATSGGTAQSTYTTGDILYASGTNALAKLGIGTSGQALKVSAGGIPEWAAAGGSSSLTITDFTASASQTTFTVSYTVGLVEGVYRNGVKLGLADYTASSGTTVVLGTGATSGDLIQVVAFSAISLGSVVNTIDFGSTGLTPSTATGGTVTVAGTLTAANGGTGRASHTAYAVICGGTTTTAAQQSIASVGTSGQVLTSNGAGALPTFQAAAGGFATGTRMSFQQTAAPTGWTKDTTAAINDSLLRLITGSVTPSGGTVAFSTWNAQTATGATTLSTAQIPSHSHTVYGAGDAGAGAFSYGNPGGTDASTSATGGGGSHTHPLTQGIKYYDFIIAAKD